MKNDEIDYSDAPPLTDAFFERAQLRIIQELKPIPRFETEDEEREFWAAHDSTELVDWSRAKPITFSRLKRSTRTISLEVDSARPLCG